MNEEVNIYIKYVKEQGNNYNLITISKNNEFINLKNIFFNYFNIKINL